jgi:hypothetical protein
MRQKYTSDGDLLGYFVSVRVCAVAFSTARRLKASWKYFSSAQSRARLP